MILNAPSIVRFLLSSRRKISSTIADWQVENCLHLVKDRWWDEDKHYMKRPGLGTAFAVLLNAALSVLRWVQKPGEPLTQTAENFLHAPKKTLHCIGVD